MQEKKKTDEAGTSNAINNSKVRDAAAKMIFGEPALCAQFLNEYIDIPILKNVRPEDIEDVSNRYVHMFTEERNSDVVKRIHVRAENGEELPFFLISLIEHKNNVDYNVTMQILRYMVYIWEEYEKEMEKIKPGISKTKGFRYPMVLPIIFYDGFRNWTATTQLKERVFLSDVLLKYIPDFECILVQLKDYSNVELMSRKNELALVMLFEKLESSDDIALLKDADVTFFKEAVQNSPKYLLDVISCVIEVFLARLNIPQDEINAFAGLIKEKKMAELFANFKAYDVQAVRAEARKLGLEEGREAGHEIGLEEGREAGREIGLEEGREEGREIGIEKLLRTLMSLSIDKNCACEKLMEQYELTLSEAQDKMKRYWN